jgi:lysophospholipase L1-like esterase
MVDDSSQFNLLMRIRTIAAYVFSVALGLVCAEAALRLVGARFASSFYVVDPDLGWSLRPNASGHHTEEAVVPIQINAAGMRDRRGYTLSKPSAAFRVAILGDSFAEAMQVPLEESFAWHLERDLKEAGCVGSRPIEILNFGVQGYGTAQELLTWRLRASAYRPDVAVLLFYTGNDLYNNHRKLNPTNADAAPYFVLDPANGKLELQPALAKPGALREAWAAMARHSRLAQFLTDTFYKTTRTATPKNTAEFGENYIDKLIYGPPKHPAMQEAWAVTEALLPVFRSEVEGSGTRFVLALASSGMQVHPDSATRTGFLEFTGGTDLFYTEKRIAEVAARNGIRVLDLGQLMLREVDGKRRFLHGFPGNLGKGHWNADGHRFVSRQITQAVCDISVRP